jgi:acetyl esterase/lipase
MKSLQLSFLALILLLPGTALAGDEKKPAASKPADAKASSAVESFKDIPYFEGQDADSVRHKLDLYLPKAKKNFPVVMFVHGGTWKSGKKDLYAPLGEVFARNGLGMVIVNYRLSPAVQHPAHVQDVARAFAWTFRNIAKYGGRPDQLFICGHSAGGHLVALLATAQNYLQAEKLDLDKIKGVIALSGVYAITGNRLNQAFGSDPKVHEEASPLKHVKSGLPPFLIVYADNDFAGLEGLAKAMGKALAEKKDNVEVIKMDNRDHYTIIRSMLSETDPTTQAALKFIKKLTETPAKN